MSLLFGKVLIVKDIPKKGNIMNWNRALYFVLASLILGQMIVGNNFFIGQSFYLVANVTAVARDFALDRPAADKVKNICMLSITIGLIVSRLFF